MLREIIFRGKRADNGKWVEGQLLYFKSSVGAKEFSLIVESCEWDNSNEWFNLGKRAKVIPETVGQYTGLTDKNGTKIFEGDILRTGTRMGYVLFEKGCFSFRWKNFDKYRPDFFKTCIITEYGAFKELEVIGNIHDNPELLEV